MKNNKKIETLKRHYTLWLKTSKPVDHYNFKGNLRDLAIRKKLKGIEKIAIQEYLKNMRNKRYYKWIVQAENLMSLHPDFNPLNHPFMRLIVSGDLQRLSQLLSFEFAHYLQRACFLKLAERFQINLNQDMLSAERQTISTKLRALFDENRGIEKEEAFYDLFCNAYRSALLDIQMYFNVRLNTLEHPTFGPEDLIKNKNNKTGEFKNV